jgi:hypothetical protein
MVSELTFELFEFSILFLFAEHCTKQDGVYEKSILSRVAAIPPMTWPGPTHLLGRVMLLLSQAQENTNTSSTNNMNKLSSKGMLRSLGGPCGDGFRRSNCFKTMTD